MIIMICSNLYFFFFYFARGRAHVVVRVDVLFAFARVCLCLCSSCVCLCGWIYVWRHIPAVAALLTRTRSSRVCWLGRTLIVHERNAQNKSSNERCVLCVCASSVQTLTRGHSIDMNNYPFESHSFGLTLIPYRGFL